MPERIYRKDYKVSPYLISQTELWFDVVDSGVIVKSKIHFYRNELSKDRLDNLFLNGENLELIDLKISHQPASFEKKEDGLLLKDLNDKFVLEISNKIYPERNTSLEGLYLSNGNYCTQCEAHGFRKITYYLDRPDVLSIFTTHIKADKDSLPVQLSNGNPVELNNGYVSWHDPEPKPCYLFALVMGNLSSINDTFITKSGKKVSLDIFVESRNIHKTDFAMQALKRAFKWDEERFNLEYDLDKFMIVAVDDFNMGAMENKGLNIFNSSYVLADKRTATDVDFINIESVIGHEYFHNWTGNRVTCRDWFQLSLKEGLTVFRDQEFTSDLHSRSVKRIEDVFALKSYQFPEDAGPMSHPVRPDSYIEMNNFYTATVYEKGAELIRMIHTIIGEDKFQEGMQNYFKRYDHQAVTIDDFVNSMNEVSDHDFTQFMNWYSRAGTPRVKIDFKPKAKKGGYALSVEQEGESIYEIPMKYSLISSTGKILEKGLKVINKQKQTFEFQYPDQETVVSVFQDFSAPVICHTNTTFKEKIFLVNKDNDPYNRWQNSQEIWSELIFNKSLEGYDFFEALSHSLKSEKDYSLLSMLISPPSEKLLQQDIEIIDVFEIKRLRDNRIESFFKLNSPELKDLYHKLNEDIAFDLSDASVGKRALKNVLLRFISLYGESDIALQQFKEAQNMTDKMAAFKSLLDSKFTRIDEIIDSFYDEFKKDTQVIDKWFSAQALSINTDIEKIIKLSEHNDFSYSTPNRLRSLFGAFSQNFCLFHQESSYEIYTETIRKLNVINPQIGARLVSQYNQWKRFTPELRELQKNQLDSLADMKDLSKDIFEIVNNALNK